MNKILVIRFSAMGDVALTAPVIQSVLEAYPNVQITFLSRGFFEPLFNQNSNFQFKTADLKGEHDGIIGLRKLYKTLKKGNFDAVIDLHDVLRTKVLRSFFKIAGTPVFKINKGRKEKKQLIEGKIPFLELKHTQQRYLDVFDKAGFNTILNQNAFLKIELNHLVKTLVSNFKLKENQKLVGIAPFAAHESKELGLTKVRELLSQLTNKEQHFVVLFGGGKLEQEKLEKLASENSNCISIIGKLGFNEELMLMKKLDVMIAMDSGNMHLASLVGTKVVSIWGPTHPFLGFSPYNNKETMVQVNRKDLPCRPCTVYGKLQTDSDKECAKQSMEKISIEMILEKLNFCFHN